MDLLKEMSVIIVLFKGEFFCRKTVVPPLARSARCAPFILSVMLSGTKILVQVSVQQVAHFEITLQQKSKWRCIFCPHRFGGRLTACPVK